MSDKASSTCIHTVVITSTDLSGSQDTFMLHVISCLVGTSIKLTGGKITTGIGLSVSILYFLNRTTGWWSAISSTIAECASKDTYVDTFYTSFYLHEYVSLLYCDIMSLYHIILGGRCYITNCHDNNLAHRLCTT